MSGFEVSFRSGVHRLVYDPSFAIIFQLRVSAQAICELLKTVTALTDRTPLLHATVILNISVSH